MPKFMSDLDKDTKYESITLHLPNWMLERINEKIEGGVYDSRSEYIQIALNEYLEVMIDFYNTECVSGARILTVSSNPIKCLDSINEICLEKKEISRSEMARNAVRWKLINERILEKKNKKELLPEGYVIVPGYNNNKPIKTRRLE
ncbi:MAG: ribbon-helix-helix domain-containing protein [Candidatus Hodarchaeota archaeon]